MVDDTAKSRRRKRRDPHFLVGTFVRTASDQGEKTPDPEPVTDEDCIERPVGDQTGSNGESFFDFMVDQDERRADNEKPDEEVTGDSENSIFESASSEDSYVLIRRATSLNRFQDLNDENSVKSIVARGRSNGIFGSVSSSDDSVNIEFHAGQIKVDSGYVMHFVDRRYTDLSIYDILTLPDVGCYPVKRATLETLPHHAVTTLQRDGHLKFTANYDGSTKEFYGYQYGWDIEQVNPADVLAEMLLNSDEDKLASFVYYFIHRFASEHYATPESIAEIRDIKSSSVVDAIKKAERSLDQSLS